MADNTGTEVNGAQGITTQTGAADPSGSGTGFTPITSQEEFDKRIKARIDRVKATPPADYDELKAKAAKLDELENAQKSEIERITEQATKAQKDASDWQAKFEELQAQRQHELDVRKAAATYGVDADVLMRMGGDVDENAKFLQEKDAARPKFGDMRDGGQQEPPTQTLEEALKSAKNTQERIQVRAEYKARNRK